MTTQSTTRESSGDGPFVEAGFLQASLPVQPDGLLVVSTGRAQVQIRSHDADDVRVLAEARGPSADRVVFTFDRDEEDVYFETDEEAGLWTLLSRPRIRVELWVPRLFSVDVETRGGPVRIEEIRGSVATRSRGGAQHLVRIAGPVEMHSNGGRQTAEQIRGDLECHSSGGGVRIADMVGDLTVRTSGGSVEVEDLDGAADVRTSGGSVRVGFSDDGEGEITTSGGSVHVGLLADARCTLDAKTGGGSVSIEHPALPDDGKHKYKGKKFSGQLNGGGAPLRLRTSGGTIRIEER